MDVACAPYPVRSGFYFSPLKVYEYLAGGKAVVTVREPTPRTAPPHRTCRDSTCAAGMGS